MNLQGIDHRFFRVVWLNPPLADSYNDFRGSQGNNGWEYGHALPATDEPASPEWFRPLPLYVGEDWLVDADLYWTLLGRDTMHPNGTITSGGKEAVEQWPVLRWTAGSAAPLRIAISIRDLNANGGNGVVVRVFHQGTELRAETIANGGESTFEVLAGVNAGDRIDVALDPRESDDLSDVTGYRVLIYEQ
jgi:hypothetical protein